LYKVEQIILEHIHIASYQTYGCNAQPPSIWRKRAHRTLSRWIV
jgi:hypothetical protein